MSFRRVRYLGWAWQRVIRRWRAGALAALGPAALVALGLAWPMDVPRYLEVQASREMTDRSGRLLYAFLNEGEQWCFPRALPEISPYLVRATLAAEDQRFQRHGGVDARAVLRAAWQNVARRRIVSGASTLSMQVVKHADRTPRSLAGKVRQAWQAVRLDLRVEKDVILETYLNTAPYGLNLVGCEAAAQRFFGKPAAELTLAEAALLAGLPKAPGALNPLRDGRAARARRQYVLRRMLEEGYITEAACRRAANEPLGAAWHPLPDLAPHLALRLKPLAAQRRRLQTTLARETQAVAERLVARHVAAFGGEIGNAAALVIDAPAASVLARVGSADFFETPGGGQVDACRAARSPGSALKPFTYAVALEQSLLYPTEMLLDATLDYGLYGPENFDRRYHGLVTASEGLGRSLNVPAVTVLERTGYERVHAFLRRAGLTTLLRPAGHYGLGLTLGSCEVRLEELAAAYVMLAHLGEYRPLQVVAWPAREPARRLLSRGTCLALYAMLEQPLPDEAGAGLVPARGTTPRVCWKTGTSTGHRDAWTFLFNRQYVVGVWLGNNDGRASRRLVGVEAALPLAAAIFRSLPATGEPAWPNPGHDLKAVQVCAASGLPATVWCRAKKEALLPREQYLSRVCDVHYPTVAAEGDGSETAVGERWPGSARGWDLARVTGAAGALSFGGAVAAGRREGLRILAPSDKAEFILTGEPSGDRIRLRSSVDEQASLHWYLNDSYLGRSEPQRPLLLALEPGEHKLTCMTAEGVTDQVRFGVARPDVAMRFRSGAGW